MKGMPGMKGDKGWPGLPGLQGLPGKDVSDIPGIKASSTVVSKMILCREELNVREPTLCDLTCRVSQESADKTVARDLQVNGYVQFCCLMLSQVEMLFTCLFAATGKVSQGLPCFNTNTGSQVMKTF